MENCFDNEIMMNKINELIGGKTLNVKLKKLRDDAVIPQYAHDGDVGMDMTAVDVEYDEKNDMYIYHTGLAFESDFNIGQFLFPRSSNRKTDCYLCNSVGIADSAIYRGEIMFCYKDRTSLKQRALVEALDNFAAHIGAGGSMIDASELYDMKIKEVEERAKNLEFAPYKVGDRIGQMVFMFYPTVNINVCEELADSVRGANGFGSTGK